MTPKTKIIISLAVLVILVLAWFAFGHNSKIGNKAGNNPSTQTSSSTEPTSSQTPLNVTKTEVPKNQAPQGFPADIPIEKGATITQNYNATADNGLVQATRTFITKQTLDQNFTIYSNYLKNAGWSITNTLNLSTTKVLSAKKGDANLQITISTNSITKVNTVDISYSSQN